ncbi:MAG TPA: glycosyltransferase [Candidatus Aphodovivens excrementavium]|nr:glycosyltransferase [Candidatus Aphodovivens excrementavium]
MTTISIVIPAYNAVESLPKTVKSLQQQTLTHDALEIILINDGSADDTLQVCQELATADPRITVIDKPNGGVGSARNAGIEAARGRYIAFLDSDDTLLPETLEAAVRFFDEHYDEIDLVSYPMRLYNEQREWSHVREQILAETGVYDLTKLQNAFALVTNVNVIVKNDDSLPRFREDLLVHEDELFFMNVLLRKQKVGFSKKGAYRYYQRPGSAVSTKMHPLYQFEKNIGFWEELFSRYNGSAPLYLQASFLNEINWKLRKDLLLPYHYGKKAFQEAIDRIRALMAHVDDDVIFTSPRADEYYRCFLARLKPSADLICSIEQGCIVLRRGEAVLLCRNHVDADVVKTRVSKEALHLEGALESILFEWDPAAHFFLELDGTSKTEIPLSSTLRDYREGHIRTCRFAKFEATIPLEKSASASFSLRIGDEAIPIDLVFSEKANLNTQNGIESFATEDCLVATENRAASLSITKFPSSRAKIGSWLQNTRNAAARSRKTLAVRCFHRLSKRSKRPLWLYYDRGGVGGDNAYLQFIHDLPINDGIDRYYVSKDSQESLRNLFSESQLEHVLSFASAKHRLMHLNASRIIASYIEHQNWCPFAPETMRGLADIIRYDMVYLQHGVLHAHMPWKFGADNRLFDFEVVSTQFEIDNLTANYGFRKEQLITSGMPRYDLIDADASPQRKILFAPSWRKYLVSEQPGLKFEAKKASFLESSFWTETRRFLESDALLSLLKATDFTLSIKLHPNFAVYEDEFKRLSNDRIRLVNSVRESDYAVFVTDYSSWVFDFAYLKRAIAYFLPDKEEFAAGLNGYHQLDLPLEEGFGPLCETAEEILSTLERILAQDGTPAPEYARKMDGFFLHYDNRQRDRLYEALMKLS